MLFLSAHLEPIVTPMLMTADEIIAAKNGNQPIPFVSRRAKGPEDKPRKHYTDEQRHMLLTYFNDHPEMNLSEVCVKLDWKYTSARYELLKQKKKVTRPRGKGKKK